MKRFNLSREQAIKLILKITNEDDPYWENIVEDYYDEKTDSMPTIYDILRPLGITKEEINKVEGI